MRLMTGIFTVSIDYELYWGVRDKVSLERYWPHLEDGPAIREILRAFRAYGVHATWALVGFMFFKDLAELRAHLPALRPAYASAGLSPYPYIAAAATLDPKYHFAPETIALIREYEGQEIGTHTFSHYYCLEAGQSLEAFKADLRAAVQTAEREGIKLKSLVFPRDQQRPDYLAALEEAGLQCYRGNPAGWIYKATDESGQHLLRRAVRLLDSYLNLSGHHTHDLRVDDGLGPLNIPSSRFLRPYSRKLAALESLRLKRITDAMDDAAVHKRLFHLCWHPYNFGVNTEQNLAFLGRILEHYKTLEKAYGMKSLNMGEVAELWRPVDSSEDATQLAKSGAYDPSSAAHLS